MRKIKLISYSMAFKKNDLIVICCESPIEENLTLCGNDKTWYDEEIETTEPVNCPDCLQIIRECQQIKLEE